MDCKEQVRARKIDGRNGLYKPTSKWTSFRVVLQRYCDLVICPQPKQRLNVAALNAQRLAAAWRVIAQRPSIAPDLAAIGNNAFPFSEMDAFRMQVDAMHMRGRK